MKFTIRFANNGEATIEEFTLTDTWPSELELLSTESMIRNSISPSRFDDPERIRIRTLSNSDRQITLEWDEDLEPGQSVSFELRGRVSREGSSTNQVCAVYEGERGGQK